MSNTRSVSREIVELSDNKIVRHLVYVENIYKQAARTAEVRNELYFKKTLDPKPILEVSTASGSELGASLSAMCLKLDGCYLESLYQSTKVFLHHPDNKRLKYLRPSDAKSAAKLTDTLLGFEYKEYTFTLERGYILYNYLYLKAALEADLIREASRYDLFADVFFNPGRSYNCQARALTLGVLLYRTGRLENALTSLESFEGIQYVEIHPYH